MPSITFIQNSSLPLIPPTIHLKLIVWQDPVSQQFRHIYSMDQIDFSGGGTKQILLLDVHCLTKFTPEGTSTPIDRYELSHFAISRLDLVDEIHHGKDSPAQQHVKTDSVLPAAGDRMQLNLSMKHRDSFYLDVLVRDMSIRDMTCLLSCDPQVENGTKT